MELPRLIVILGALSAFSARAQMPPLISELPKQCREMYTRALKSMGMVDKEREGQRLPDSRDRHCSRVFRSCQWPRQVIDHGQDFGEDGVKHVRLYHERFKWFESIELDEGVRPPGGLFQMSHDKIRWGLSIEFGREDCLNPQVICYGDSIGKSCLDKVSVEGCLKGYVPEGMTEVLMKHACYVVHEIKFPIKPKAPAVDPDIVAAVECPARDYLLEGVEPLPEARKHYLENLALALDQGTESERWKAVNGLERDVDGPKDLMAIATKDPRPELRSLALKRLASLAASSWNAHGKEALTNYLSLEKIILSPESKAVWLEGIGDLAARKEVMQRGEKILRAHLDSPEPAVKRAAIRGLAVLVSAFPTKARREELASLLLYSQDSDGIEAVVKALISLARTRDPEAKAWLKGTMGALKLPRDNPIDTFWVDSILNRLERP